MAQDKDLLILTLERLHSDMERMQDKLDDLSSFKWQVLGMSTAISAIFGLSVPLVMKFVFNV